MTVLILSLLALAVGPLAHRLAGRVSWALALLDGFVLTGVGGLVLLHIWPDSLAAGGWLALVGAVGGVLFPVILERWLRRKEVVHRATVLLGAVGLALHAFLDGLALPDPSGTGRVSAMLPVAVVLHRIPVGLAVWWMLRPVVGVRGALAMLVLVGGATVVGFSLGNTEAASALPVDQVAAFQAFVAGALLHVLFEHPSALPSGDAQVGSRENRRAATVGTLLAAASLLVLAETHPTTRGSGLGVDAGWAFLGLTLEVAPVLLGSLVLAGILRRALPPTLAPQTGPGASGPGAAAKATLLGLIWPEGARHPMPTGTATARTPASWAFGLASAGLGPAALLISLPLLGPGLTAARVVGVAATALAAALVARALSSGGTTTLRAARSVDQAEPPTWLQGTAHSMDELLPWMLAGLGAATFVEPLLSPEWIAAVPAGLDVLLGALAGTPAFLNGAAATPLVAVMLHKGLSPGAGLAFLLTGPALSAGGLAGLASARGWRTALGTAAGIVVLAVALGLAVNSFLPSGPALNLHAVRAAEAEPMRLACLILLGVAALISVLRLGPRGFVRRVVGAQRRYPHAD